MARHLHDRLAISHLDLKTLPKQANVASAEVEFTMQPQRRHAQEEQQRNTGGRVKQPPLHASILT
jgi:hypothetical protein